MEETRPPMKARLCSAVALTLLLGVTAVLAACNEPLDPAPPSPLPTGGSAEASRPEMPTSGPATVLTPTALSRTPTPVPVRPAATRGHASVPLPTATAPAPVILPTETVPAPVPTPVALPTPTPAAVASQTPRATPRPTPTAVRPPAATPTATQTPARATPTAPPTATLAPTSTPTPAPTPADLSSGRWQQTAGPPGANVAAVAVDPVSPDIVYAAVGEGPVYASFDRGENWLPTPIRTNSYSHGIAATESGLCATVGSDRARMYARRRLHMAT